MLHHSCCVHGASAQVVTLTTPPPGTGEVVEGVGELVISLEYRAWCWGACPGIVVSTDLCVWCLSFTRLPYPGKLFYLEKSCPYQDVNLLDRIPLPVYCIEDCPTPSASEICFSAFVFCDVFRSVFPDVSVTFVV